MKLIVNQIAKTLIDMKKIAGLKKIKHISWTKWESSSD